MRFRAITTKVSHYESFFFVVMTNFLENRATHFAWDTSLEREAHYVVSSWHIDLKSKYYLSQTFLGCSSNISIHDLNNKCSHFFLLRSGTCSNVTQKLTLCRRTLRIHNQGLQKSVTCHSEDHIHFKRFFDIDNNGMV